MDYTQQIKEGNLSGALSDVEALIRSQPGEVKHRIFLFQLLIIKAEWRRAGKQLEIIRKLDDGALAMVHMYQTAISCELLRESVFRGEHDPVFMGQPEEWQALLLQAFKLTVKGKLQQSKTIRDKAFELAPTSKGSVDSNKFDWIADADARLGPVIEMIIEGKYLWVSFSHIDALTIEVPTDLRDLVWLPAYVKWKNQGEGHAVIPARYPNSQRSNDLALGRRTEWEACDSDLYLGYGQKVFVTDTDEFPVLDIREISFASSEDSDTESSVINTSGNTNNMKGASVV